MGSDQEESLLIEEVALPRRGCFGWCLAEATFGQRLGLMVEVHASDSDGSVDFPWLETGAVGEKP